MKVLIVHAHENPESFCSSLANTAKRYFEENGHHVIVSDLYQKEFNPVGGKHDFESLSGATYYKYASEQLYASQHNKFITELEEEMKHVLAADILIFNFPLWWFGMPAILKGWVDRVLAYGFAYGGDYGFFNEGRFRGRRAFLCLTTGSPANFYTESGAHGRNMSNILKNIHQGILSLTGFDILPDFVGYGVSRITDQERHSILEDYEVYLNEHFL